MSQPIDTAATDMPRSLQPKRVGEHRSWEKTELEKQSLESRVLRWKLSRWILLCTGALAVGAAVLWWLDSRNYESTHDAHVQGRVDLIRARISGTIAYINPLLENKQFVKADTLLLVLDQRDYAAEFERAKANFDTRRAEVRSAQVTVLIIGATASAELHFAEAAKEQVLASVEAEQAN